MRILLFQNNIKLDDRFNGIWVDVGYDRNKKLYYCSIYPTEYNTKSGYGTYIIEPYSQNNIHTILKSDVSRLSNKILDKYKKVLDNIEESEFILKYMNALKHLDKNIMRNYIEEVFNGKK